MSNVKDLAASTPDCLGHPNASAGAITGSHDAHTHLVDLNGKVKEACKGRNAQPDTAQSDTKQLSIATAALLSARFPIISPSGALIQCPSTPDTARATYVVDGGYFENSGLLTLVQLWDRVEPMVAHYNSTASGTPESPIIEPWIVLLENHYSSVAAAAPPDRQPELVAIMTAVQGRATTLSVSALSQSASDRMCGTLPGRGDAAASPSSTGCAGHDDNSSPTIRFARISPRNAPSYVAPLGWVLSETSRAHLDSALDEALTRAPRKGEGRSVAELKARLDLIQSPVGGEPQAG